MLDTELISGYMTYTSADEVAASAEGEAPGTTYTIVTSSEVCITLTAAWGC